MDPTVFAAKKEKIISFLEELGLEDPKSMSDDQLQLAVVRIQRNNSSQSSSSSKETTPELSEDDDASEEQDPPPAKSSSKKKSGRGMLARTFLGARIHKGVKITNAIHNNNGRKDGQNYIEEDDTFSGAIIDEGVEITHNAYNNNVNYNPPPHTMPQGMPHFQPWYPPGAPDPSQYYQQYPPYGNPQHGHPQYGHPGYFPGPAGFSNITEVRTVSKSLKLPWKK